jgi:hypothetical protein
MVAAAQRKPAAFLSTGEGQKASANVTVSAGLAPARLAVSWPCAVYVDGDPASGWLAAMLFSLSVPRLSVSR